MLLFLRDQTELSSPLSGAGIPNQGAPSSSQATAGGSPPQPPSGWQRYVDSRFHFNLAYPGQLGNDESSTSSLELVFITIDPKADPIHLCAANNPQGWTPRQLFESWKQNPPAVASDVFPCADYPSYAKITTSSIAIGDQVGYQVISYRGSFETVCSYFATKQTLLAICLSPEDPDKSANWADHLEVYRQILASINFSG
jgi:hypothetical protein